MLLLIMLQFLYRENYKVTNKVDKEKMKDFAIQLPDDYNKKE